MRRSARLVALTGALVFSATLLGAGPASAAPSPAHGFGAQRPTQQIAPRTISLRMQSLAGTNVAAASLAVVTTPVSVDLRKWAVTPGNQGQLNSCVPWTIDYAMLGWYSHFTGRVGQPFAPMYTYSQINHGGDWGASATDALDLAVVQGNDTRADYTPGDSNWKTQPTAAQRVSAARFMIKGYTTLFAGVGQTGSVTLLKQAIATNHPVAIEMDVRDGFYYIGTSASAIDNDVSSAILGSHEVLAVGYDGSGLIVQNSWGTGWGDGGFGRISWRVVQHDVGEAQTIGGFVQGATAPVVSAPAVGYRAAGASASLTAKYTISWKGTTGNTGAITRYNVSYQVDGGSFVPVKLASATSTSFVLNAVIHHRYRVAVRASTATSSGPVHYGATFTA